MPCLGGRAFKPCHGCFAAPRHAMVALQHHAMPWLLCSTTPCHGCFAAPSHVIFALQPQTMPWLLFSTTPCHGCFAAPRHAMVAFQPQAMPWLPYSPRPTAGVRCETLRHRAESARHKSTEYRQVTDSKLLGICDYSESVKQFGNLSRNSWICKHLRTATAPAQRHGTCATPGYL